MYTMYINGKPVDAVVEEVKLDIHEEIKLSMPIPPATFNGVARTVLKSRGFHWHCVQDSTEMDAHQKFREELALIKAIHFYESQFSKSCVIDGVRHALIKKLDEVPDGLYDYQREWISRSDRIPHWVGVPYNKKET